MTGDPVYNGPKEFPELYLEELAEVEERKARRDLFAAAALQGLIARPWVELEDGWTPGRFAQHAWVMADAMLKESEAE